MLKRLLFLALFLLLSVQTSKVTRYPSPPSDGMPCNNPTPVIRLKKLDDTFVFSLVKERFTGFPQLNDNFYLQIPQLVHFSYIVRVPMNSLHCHLQTRMNIDNTFDKSFWFISSNQYYTTHQISGDVYLEKGDHSFKVMYFTSCDIVAVDTKHVWYGALQIKYLEYPRQQYQVICTNLM